MSYLIHVNRNHSAKNGQFISGDGDGDGIVNDHGHSSLNRVRVGSNTLNGKRNFSRTGSGKITTIGSNPLNGKRNFSRTGSGKITTVGSNYVSSLRDININKFIDDEEENNRPIRTTPVNTKNPDMYYGPAKGPNPEEQKQHEDERRRGIINTKSYSDNRKQFHYKKKT